MHRLKDADVLGRAAFGIAAVTMTAITIGLLVVLPAKIYTQEARTLAASKAVTTAATEIVVNQPRVTGKPMPRMIAHERYSPDHVRA